MGFVVFFVELFFVICGAIVRFILEHTDEADCVLIGIISGICIRTYLKWHTVFCIVIGILITVVFWLIMNTRVGFWLIATPISLFWAIMGYCLGADKIWSWTLFFIFGGAVLWLHICAHNNTNKAIFDDDEYQQTSYQADSNATHETYENQYEPAQECNQKSNDDYYEILGLKPGASQDEIKAAYRKLSKKYHPDVNDAANASVVFRLINEAYNALVIK